MKIKEITKVQIDYLNPILSLLAQLTSSPKEFSLTDLKEVILSDNTHLFLLFDKDVIAGMLTIAIYKSPTGSKAWIEDVVVDNKYRGQGLGRLLIQHAIKYCKSKKINSLMLTSNPRRVAANNLYQSVGFEQKITNVYKKNL